MTAPFRLALIVQTFLLVLALAIPASASHFGYDANYVLTIDYTRKVFPIGLTLPPAPNAKTPTGKRAFKELADDGVLFIRTGIGANWDASGYALEKQYEDAAAKYGLYCQIYLRSPLAESYTSTTDAQLTTLINTFKGHPGLGIWKGSDEPWWGYSTGGAATHKDPTTLTHVYQLIKSLDPDHPVWIVQAPRGTASDLAPYTPTSDIAGVDIYPVSYPPGKHLTSDFPNKEISCVGDWTDTIVQATSGTRMIQMTLQIAFSGTIPPKNQLRFPTFDQQRFMAYYCIVHGARGLQYFGPTIAATLNSTDAPLGFNWTYWNNVMKPLLAEIGTNSPIESALTAANANLGITGNNGVEFVTRQISSSEFYIIACMKQGPTNAATQVTFSGIPAGYTSASVVFEEPSTVAIQSGSFTTYFGPFDVHVYHFTK